MIVSFTGHRPPKVGGYSTPNPTFNYVNLEIIKHLKKLNPEKVITGMALGVDQWVAQICIDLNIPFIAAIPFKGQELYWPVESRDKYFELLSHTEDVVCVNVGGFASWKMQTRNEWMVDNSDILISVFDGSAGGTKNCFDYANGKEKTIIRINPLDHINK